MKPFKQTWRALLKQQDGAALIEFVFVLPILLIIMVGTIELSNLVYARQKAQSAAENIANLINLRDDVSTADLQQIADILPRVMRPFPIGQGQYRVIVTAMQRDLGDEFAYVRWQESFGANVGASEFTYAKGAGKDANRVGEDVLNGFSFIEGDQVLLVETYVFYQPILDNDLMDGMLGLRNSFLYQITPPTRPRTGKFQFFPDDPNR